MLDAQVLYGPPGTGKTQELLRRLEQTIESKVVDRSKIGFLSFTKAAAYEALSRMGLKSHKKVSTLHAQVYRLLQLSKDQVIDDDKLREFGEVVGVEITGADQTSERELSIGDEYLQIISFARARLLSPQDVWLRYSPGSPRHFAYFLDSYQGWKKANGFVDFNDMLSRYVDHPKNPEIEVLFIDEAQDLSCLQWAVVDKMLGYVREVHVAGDDDQAIYEWSGAYAPGMAEFEQRYKAHRVVLDQSWRLPRRVHSVANNLVSRIRERVAKTFNPRDVDGSVSRNNGIGSVQLRADRDTLVLYRNHASRKDIEGFLIENCVPYRAEVGFPGILATKYGRAVRTFLTLKENRDVSAADFDQLHKMKVRRDLDFSKPWADQIDMPTHFLYYLTRVDPFKAPSVRIGSIHSAKGHEADHVVLYTGMTQRTIESSLRNPDAETRVWYVGVTRAREELSIVEGWNGFDIPI